MSNTTIIGAGLSGLIAASLIPDAQVVERESFESKQVHNALLRFRSPDVGEALGIPFRKVRVHKGIWAHNTFQEPTIALANAYSHKVIGRYADRSIWNIAPCDRYIAPPDLWQQLARRCRYRISWEENVDLGAIPSAVITTAPMSVTARAIGIDAPKFSHQPISVCTSTIPHCDVYQTIYFPDPHCQLYRASITGDKLIAEYVGESIADIDVHEMQQAFGMPFSRLNVQMESKTSYGKIAPIDERIRREIIVRATLERNIFSLGRFGTWRNILLDDVLHDIYRIKRLMGASAYDIQLASS